MASEEDKKKVEEKEEVVEAASQEDKKAGEEKKEVENEHKKDEEKSDTSKAEAVTAVEESKETKNDKEEEEAPPAKPPRPLTPFQQSHLTLTEAFPSIESNVVRAVLIASGGEVDPAFNGLLSLTDPDYKVDESLLRAANVNAAPPPVPAKHQPRGALRNNRQQQQQQQNPSRYRASGVPGVGPQQRASAEAYAKAAATIRNDRSQIEEDERLARMLAEEERGNERRVRYADTGMGTTFNAPDDHRQRKPVSRTNSVDEEDRSFFDDDLPQIKDEIVQGFNETKEKVSNWFGTLRKKMDMDGNRENNNNNRRNSDLDDYEFRGDEYYRTKPQRTRGYQSGPARASAARGRYDDEDGFTGIKLANYDDGEDDEVAPALPHRPTAAPTERTSESAVTDSTGIDETKPRSSSIDNTGSGTTATTPDKKIALKSTGGAAEEEDPFFIGDSEDEDEEDVPLSEVAKKSETEKK